MAIIGTASIIIKQEDIDKYEEARKANSMNELEDAKQLIETTFLQSDIEKLQPKDRLAFYLNLMEYFVPKRQRSSINENENELPKDLY